MRRDETDRKTMGLIRTDAEGLANWAAPRDPRDGVAYGKLDAALDDFGTATVSIYTWSITGAAWVDTGINITACKDLGGHTLIAGTWVRVEWNHTKWIISNTYIPAVQRFRLTATLSMGGNATANLLTFNGTTYDASSATVYAFDWYSVAVGVSTRGMFQGVSGMEGMGLRREVPTVAGREEYDIIWMEQYAWDCEVTLTSNPTFSGTTYDSSWTATADVDKSFHQGVSPGSSITIHDDQNMYPFAKSGAKAKVIRTEHEASAPYYKLVTCQQLALYGSATLSGAVCGAATALTTGFTVLSPSPFNLAPTVTTVNNPKGHAGLHGDEVLLTFDRRDATYFISDMEVKPVSVVVGARQSPDDSDWWQLGYKSIYVEYCSSGVYWSDTMLMRQWNWWCSANYWCSGSGSGSTGSGSGSGATGGSCDCTTTPSSVTLTFQSAVACWNGLSCTLTKSGTTYSFTGDIGGDTWTFSWPCSVVSGKMAGTLSFTAPACILGGSTSSLPANTTNTNSCDPLHVEFTSFGYTGTSGCTACPDSGSGAGINFIITE